MARYRRRASKRKQEEMDIDLQDEGEEGGGEEHVEKKAKEIPTPDKGKNPAKDFKEWTPTQQQSWRESISGFYKIRCAIIEDIFKEQASNDTHIELQVDMSKDTVFGLFDNFLYRGVIRLDSNASCLQPDARLRFVWKGRPANNPDGDTDDGHIAITEDYNIQGVFMEMHGMDIDFVGVKDETPHDNVKRHAMGNFRSDWKQYKI